MIFRATYLRASRVRGMTFTAKNVALASLFAYEKLQPLITSIGGSSIIKVEENVDDHHGK